MAPAGSPADRRTSGAPARRRVAPAGRPLAAAALSCALLSGGLAACSTPAPADEPTAPTATATTPPSALAATPEPLVTASPDTHSEVGDLVAAFPSDLLPLPPDAVVLVTSAVPVGEADVQEVSLNLRTATPVADVVALYRSALTAAGFTELSPAAPATDLAAEATFVRSGGDELVSIGVLDDGTARTVTVGGRVRTPTG